MTTSKKRRRKQKLQNMLIEELDPHSLGKLSRLQSNLIARGGPDWLRPWKYWGRRYTLLYRLLAASSMMTLKSREDLERVLEEGVLPERLIDRAKGYRILLLNGNGGAGPGELLLLGTRPQTIEYTSEDYHVSKAIVSYLHKPHDTSTCLYKSLEEAREDTLDLWQPHEDLWILHIHLAKPDRKGYCRIPRFAGKSRPGAYILLDPDDPVGFRIEKGGKPRGQVVVDCSSIHWEAPGYKPYLVEIVGLTGSRSLVPLYSRAGEGLREWLRNSLPGAMRGGLYPPRLWASLRVFMERARSRGCGLEASVLLALASRTLSIYAGYSPEAGRVIPARPDRLSPPRRPVLLNPYSYRYTGRGEIASVGYGTLASYITPLVEASSEIPGLYSENIDSILYDINSSSFPLRDTSPAYNMLIAYIPKQIKPPPLYKEAFKTWPPTRRDKNIIHEKTIKLLSYKLLHKVKPRGYLVLFTEATSSSRLEAARKILELAKMSRDYGLRRLYWVPLKTPGSRVELFMAVYRRSTPSAPLERIVEPLRRAGEIAEAGGLSRSVASGLRAVVSSMSRIISRIQG